MPAQSVPAYTLAEACSVSTVGVGCDCAGADAVPAIRAQTAPQMIERRVRMLVSLDLCGSLMRHGGPIRPPIQASETSGGICAAGRSATTTNEMESSQHRRAMGPESEVRSRLRRDCAHRLTPRQ